MTLSQGFVSAVFQRLEEGDGTSFFEAVSNDVHWTVMGTHPLAGDYRSKAEFREKTFSRLGRLLPGGAQLRLKSLMIAGDWAIAELTSSAVARDGFCFNNTYCWLSRFCDEKIVEVRAYLDSALVQALIDHHSGTCQ